MKDIHTTISEGRHGQMPAWGAAFGEEKVKDVANYVLSLSKRKHDAERAARGKETFATVCVACHGPDGKGNQQLGAPNLTDNNWLYGGSEDHHRDHHQRPQQPNAGLEGLSGRRQGASADRLRLGLVQQPQGAAISLNRHTARSRGQYSSPDVI